MKSSEIRECFLKFFEKHNHEIVTSSSLVPANDPTLLFTNAGMVQFKEVFLGGESRSCNRATSSQRCVRAGGKHNDLENVGYTARHHTFFEMLGNFSFGDYFKKDAIAFAWEFLTEILKLPPSRLWVTVHESDDEAENIWINEIGIDPSRLSRLDEDNFWQMGDTGPCGPCTEIFWDHGPDVPGGPPGSENDDLDRYIEIWNLVFMQYEKSADGKMNPLPKPSIDTGMGLERISAVMQGVHSNYEIDIFKDLINATAKIAGCKDKNNDSLKVISDHIRSCSFLILDGVTPSNEGRGYVLRRIIRRALRHGNKLGIKEEFFYKLVPVLRELMGDAYPDLIAHQDKICKVLKQEEIQFSKTLDKGMAIFQNYLAGTTNSVIPGDLIFKLYDTYGFPVDLTNDIARENGLEIDMEGYNRCMQEQIARGRSASQFSVDYSEQVNLPGKTEFIGYDHSDTNATVLGIYAENNAVDEIKEGDQVGIILDKTVFYAESGGQVGDTGIIETETSLFNVVDCKKVGTHFMHFGHLKHGAISRGDKVKVEIDTERRQSITCNHSATHLLHEALRLVLGDHVEQRGSMVDGDRFRFDFSHDTSVSAEEIRKVENIVNMEIMRNKKVVTTSMSMEEAQKKGARALFGEKYGDVVRVVNIGEDFSVELCGGTHVNRSGEIGLVKVALETSVASGIRRIESCSGAKATELCNAQQDQLSAISNVVRGSKGDLPLRIKNLVDENKNLQKEVKVLKQKLASTAGNEIMQGIIKIGEISLLTKVIEDSDASSLRTIADQIRSKLDNGVFFLVGLNNSKAALVSGVTGHASDKINASHLMKFVSEQVDGKGGGRPDMAQGIANNTDNLESALDSVVEYLNNKLN
ncbi:MAG: alanine--tRNA ligase [Pseudomonadales bacterium]|nr:alanine--tRNA ligase [Pseudomonadales bacterium]